MLKNPRKPFASEYEGTINIYPLFPTRIWAERGVFYGNQQVIQEFGLDCKIRKLSPKAIVNYQKQLVYLQRFPAEQHNITDTKAVRSIHIKQFLTMMDGKGRKPEYISDLLKAFKAFFHYCEREGIVKFSPAACVHNMKQPKAVILQREGYHFSSAFTASSQFNRIETRSGLH